LRISDLPQPVTAAKSHWAAGGPSLEFTPRDASINARAICETAVVRQARDGYVLDYVTRSIESPNAGFESDPEYLRDLEQHASLAGRLIAVHRLRPSHGRPLREIVGNAAFERLQDMWARDANRCRWSVAFPIIESHGIENQPDAAAVFGPEDYRRLFAHPSTLLRPLNDDDGAKLAALVITLRPALNAWIGIEDEAVMAAGSEISEKLQRDIDRDLAASAMEGLTEEQRSKVRRRAAWLADRFLKQRRRAGTLSCDECAFDPAKRGLEHVSNLARFWMFITGTPLQRVNATQQP